MIIYVDLDNVTTNFAKAKLKALHENPSQPYPQSEYGFFANLEPIEYAIETINWLIEIGHDVYFLTAPSIKNIGCYSDKAFWVKKHFGEEMLKKLIISYDKSLLIGDYLIDDNINCNKQDKFKGQFIHFRDDFNWSDIKFYFMQLQFQKELNQYEQNKCS